ncbi:MAG: hypothetical protein ACLVEX_06575 [Ruthenibacterium lactatiformans]
MKPILMRMGCVGMLLLAAGIVDGAGSRPYSSQAFWPLLLLAMGVAVGGMGLGVRRSCWTRGKTRKQKGPGRAGTRTRQRKWKLLSPLKIYHVRIKNTRGKRGGVVGNGKGAPAGMTSMDEILSFQQQVKYLLYKISRNGAHPVPLDAVSDYKEAEAVPPEKRARLLRDLRGEVQAREIMGDEAYFGTASLISKIITYEQAMDEISNRKMIEGTRDMRVTWAEFRRMIAAEIYAESREEE